MYYLPSEARFRFKPVCVRQVRSVREVDVLLETGRCITYLLKPGLGSNQCVCARCVLWGK